MATFLKKNIHVEYLTLYTSFSLNKIAVLSKIECLYNENILITILIIQRLVIEKLNSRKDYNQWTTNKLYILMCNEYI